MMKTFKNFALPVLILALSLAGKAVFAQQTTEPSVGKNVIESVQASQQDGSLVVKVNFKAPFDGQIGSFSVASPARVAVDFPNAQSATGQSSVSFNEGDLRSANIVQVADRTRLVLNLLRPLSFTTKVDGKVVLITLTQQTVAKGGDASPSQRFAEPQTIAGSDLHGIRDINFRRGSDGEGRVVVDLSDVGTGIDIRQQGADLMVDFIKTTLPERLRRKLDVTDFGTPVSTVVTTQQGSMVHMVVSGKGLWEHNAYQTDTQLVLEVKPIKEDPNKLVQGGSGAQKYAGEKLSLNFQNIDIRSVLNAIAEFTNFNIVTSDSVTGSLTLRLKDVPWDQALDIILQAKGLDMRKNGGVIWIAPRDELAAREKLALDSKSQIADLEPLRTETFQINYHSAKTIYDSLLGSEKDKTKLLSKRGVVVMDARSNKLIISDTAARLDDMRRLLQEIDVPVRQVVIEAQIVEASDSFSRNIGARIGVHNQGATAGNRYTFGGSLADTGFHTGQTTTTPDFLADSTFFNNAAPSINSKTAGALSLVLWNRGATKFLNLELSALEADGRGKIVSRPRVMTSDQNEAVIEAGTDIPYQVCNSSSTGGGSSGCTISYRKAVLSLKVTPHITPDGKVAMKIDVNKDSPNSSLSTSVGIAVDTKHVSTDVLVENGGTVVLGGIYQQDTQNNTTKIPFLGDIPVLGYLFRENERSDSKNEMMVFITPRILTDQTASR